jgi:hypothetical protein
MFLFELVLLFNYSPIVRSGHIQSGVQVWVSIRLKLMNNTLSFSSLQGIR